MGLIFVEICLISGEMDGIVSYLNIYVMLYSLTAGCMELKQGIHLDVLSGSPLVYLYLSYTMGPSKGKEVLEEKGKSQTRKATEGLCNNKHNYKSQLIMIIRTNYINVILN